MNSSLCARILALLDAPSLEEVDRRAADALAFREDVGDESQRVLERVAQAVREKFLLEQKIAELERIDASSGLSNRRAFDERIDAELRRSARSRRSFALICIEIDDAAADLAEHVTRIAAAVRQHLRRIDFAARLSERRVGMIVVDVNQSTAQAIVGRIANLLIDARVPAATGMALSYPVDTPETLVERADAAVYDARFSR